MKPLITSLTLLFMGVLATVWQYADASMLVASQPFQAGPPPLATHSCDNPVKEEGVDEVGEESGEGITPDNTRSSRQKQRGREVYAQNLADVMTGERCTLYAVRPLHQQDWLALTVSSAIGISVRR